MPRTKIYDCKRYRVTARVEESDYNKIVEIAKRNGVTIQEYFLAVIKDDLRVREIEQLRENSAKLK